MPVGHYHLRPVGPHPRGSVQLTVPADQFGEFAQWLTSECKVAAIPVSAFYEQDAVTSVVRFCFAKKDATLDTALERLADAVHHRKKANA